MSRFFALVATLLLSFSIFSQDTVKFDRPAILTNDQLLADHLLSAIQKGFASPRITVKVTNGSQENITIEKYLPDSPSQASISYSNLLGDTLGTVLTIHMKRGYAPVLCHFDDCLSSSTPNQHIVRAVQLMMAKSATDLQMVIPKE